MIDKDFFGKSSIDYYSLDCKNVYPYGEIQTSLTVYFHFFFNITSINCRFLIIIECVSNVPQSQGGFSNTSYCC